MQDLKLKFIVNFVSKFNSTICVSDSLRTIGGKQMWLDDLCPQGVSNLVLGIRQNTA